MKPIYLRVGLLPVLLVLFCQIMTLAATPIKYKIERDAAGTYRVYMSSVTSYTGNLARIGTAQVTVVVPKGSFTNLPQGTGSPTVTGYNSMAWSANTRVDAPTENANFDYISFGFNQSGSPTLFNIPANQDILLFSFSDGGNCPGVVTLWSTSDLFQGASSSTNPGNQMSILGNGPGNAYGSNYGSATSCGAPDLVVSVGPVPSLTVGQAASLPVSVSNVGTLPATGPLTFATVLPSGITAPASFSSNGWGCTTTGQSVSCTNPSSLSNGNASLFGIPITPVAGSAGTTPTFSGTVSSPTTDSNPANNVAPPVSGQPVQGILTGGCVDCLTGVRYGLKLSPDGVTYTVYMKSATAYSGNNARVITAQVTLNIPTSTQITSLTSLQTGMTWALNTRVNTPTEAPTSDYPSFSYSQSANPSSFSIGANVEIPLFRFQRVGVCSGELGLWTTTDPFQGISTTTNPGNQMTIQGNGPNNAWMCNYTCPIACTAPALQLVKLAPSTATQGTPFSYTLTVTNIGTGPTSGTITVADILPTGMLFVSGGGNGWGCLATGQTVSCTSAAPLAVSASSSFLLTVNPTAVGTQPNSATVSGGSAPTAVLSASCPTCLTGPTQTSVVSGTLQLAVKALLQGSFDPATGLMYDKLRQQNRIPLTQPYGSLTGTPSFTLINSGTGTTTSAVLSVTGTNAIVDWVLIELRSSSNPASVLASTPALIQRDGDVVSPVDGVSPLLFTSTTAASYYVAVRHRNHLGVMSAQAIPLSATLTTVNFTSAANVYVKPGAGNYPQYIDPTSSKAMLWTGNTSGDNQVIFQGPNADVDPIFYRIMGDGGNTGLIANYITYGYDVTDINMDGLTIFQGPDNEVDIIFFNVIGHPDNTNLLANFIVQQHLP